MKQPFFKTWKSPIPEVQKEEAERASLGQNRGIQRLWAWQCEVRCLIGIGNIYTAKAQKKSGIAKADACKQAQDYYGRAIEMATLIGYDSNKKTAQENLKHLKKICP